MLVSGVQNMEILHEGPCLMDIGRDGGDGRWTLEIGRSEDLGI
jgi:hypothetical protein